MENETNHLITGIKTLAFAADKLYRAAELHKEAAGFYLELFNRIAAANGQSLKYNRLQQHYQDIAVYHINAHIQAEKKIKELRTIAENEFIA
jgi:hypothetical protein